MIGGTLAECSRPYSKVRRISISTESGCRSGAFQQAHTPSRGHPCVLVADGSSAFGHPQWFSRTLPAGFGTGPPSGERFRACHGDFAARPPVSITVCGGPHHRELYRLLETKGSTYFEFH